MATGIGGEKLWLMGPTGITDQSSEGNDGTYNGSMGVVADTGEGGTSAFEFNGSDQWISITDGYTNTLSGIDSWTITLWFKAVEIASYPMLWANRKTSTDRVLLEIGPPNGGRTYLATKASTSTYFDSALALDTWHHVIIEKLSGSGTGKVKCWLNGVSESVTGDGGQGVTPTISSEDFLIGRWESGLYFEGRIDDFRIFNRSLTSTEITNLSGQRGYQPANRRRRMFLTA